MILIYLIVTSVVAVLMTRHCIIHRNLSPIRASTALTLSFVALTSFFAYPDMLVLQAGFFGASFVGMTEPTRMSNRTLLMTACVFSFVFYFVIPHTRGLGGALGCGAFISCLLILGSYKFFNLIKKKYQIY